MGKMRMMGPIIFDEPRCDQRKTAFKEPLFLRGRPYTTCPFLGRFDPSFPRPKTLLNPAREYTSMTLRP